MTEFTTLSSWLIILIIIVLIVTDSRQHNNGQTSESTKSNGQLLKSIRHIQLALWSHHSPVRRPAKSPFTHSGYSIQRATTQWRIVKVMMPQRVWDDFEYVHQIHLAHPPNKCHMAAFVLFHKVICLLILLFDCWMAFLVYFF